MIDNHTYPGSHRYTANAGYKGIPLRGRISNPNRLGIFALFLVANVDVANPRAYLETGDCPSAMLWLPLQ